MIEDRFAKLNLEILKVQSLPDGSRPIARLLQDWGLGKEPQECFWVIAVDVVGHIRTVVEVARGGHDRQEVHIPSVMTAVLSVGASSFTVAHNHPSIDIRPSVPDGVVTHTIMDAANACGLSFEEHLIIGPTPTYFSFVDAGLLIPLGRGGAPALEVSKSRKMRTAG